MLRKLWGRRPRLRGSPRTRSSFAKSTACRPRQAGQGAGRRPGNPSFPIARLQDIGAYNATNPMVLVQDPVTNTSYYWTGTFDGVILDVEPTVADQNLLDLYTCSQAPAAQYGYGLSVAINAFWDYTIGSGGPAYRQILDMNFDNVVVMGYRNFAGTFGADDGGTLPTDVSSQAVSANVPAYVSIGAVTASITFPNVSNSNATVTVMPVNPATQTLTPTGFQLTNLAFDVSTTAVFTGPVTVCFSVPLLDAPTFASLRVLHYVGGVAIDQTILSGPNAPNPATQTICASVTSFSPFVLAKATFVAMSAFHVSSFTADKNNFHLQGDFTLPANAAVTDGAEVTLTLGTAVLKIPAGQLKQDGHNDHFNFEGTVNGATLHVELQRHGKQPYQLNVEGQQIDLTKQAEPMLVQLQVGKYLGSAIVFASVHN